jgi:hypothetical protein
VNNELEGIWREEIVAYWQNYPGICLEELRKATNSLKIAGVPAKTGTVYLLTALPLYQPPCCKPFYFLLSSPYVIYLNRSSYLVTYSI